MLLVCVVLFCVVFVSGGSRNLEGTSPRNCQPEQKQLLTPVEHLFQTDYTNYRYTNFIPELVYDILERIDKGSRYVMKKYAE